jgi:hypothetical protein
LDLNEYGENVYENLKEYKDDIYVLIKGQLKQILSPILFLQQLFIIWWGRN